MRIEERFLDMMIKSLILMASDYEKQVQTFPEFVYVPDEIVLTFDEAYKLFDQVVESGYANENQNQTIQSVHSFINEMSQRKDRNLWTHKAMKESIEWQKMRILAKQALFAFDKSIGEINIDWVKFVPSKRKRNNV